MVVKEKTINQSVLKITKKRIQNLFETVPKIYFSVSGGKDSTVLMDLVYKHLIKNLHHRKKIVFRFIDEEAMFEDVIQNVKDWRKKYINLGCKFNWYCIQIRHYNCLNTLDSDESFITWNTNKKKQWVRPKPKFAITNHPQLRERKDTYQDFLTRISTDGITIMGVRLDESIHRRITMSKTLSSNHSGISLKQKKAYPIYDWKDKDIWKYIHDNQLYFPETYIKLYKCGVPINHLRISQFFSIDTARILQKMDEHTPGLMERIIKREPNAYLASLYWDTELFRRPKGVHKNKQKEKNLNYKKMTIKELHKLQKENRKPTETKGIKKIIITYHKYMNNTHYKQCYRILKAGDVKKRAMRSLEMKIYRDLVKK